MAQQPQTGDGSIKIVSVAWYKVLPPKFGGQKAVALFNEHLGQIASLDCICSKNNNVVDASYRIHPVLPVGRWQFINPLVWRKIFLAAKRHRATHLILEFPYHGITGVACKRFLKIKLIVNSHNIEYRRFKEQKRWWWGLLYHLEKWTLKNADLVFFKTANDKNAAKNLFNLDEKKLAVTPYGVERPPAFSKQQAQNHLREKHGIGPHQKILLFAGTLDYGPNAEAVVAIKEQIIPLLEKQDLSFKIIVCGRNQYKNFQHLKSITDANLVMAGEVDDIQAYLMGADLFMNPVCSGGGVQTKTADALSFHLNVVCFESKAQGIEQAANKIFTAKDGDWHAFASAVCMALEKSEETSPAFFENYNWRSIAAKAFQKIAAC